MSEISSADSKWIKLAKDAYSRSTTFFEKNYKKRFEDDLRMFQSKHPTDSKYNSDNYKYRSKIFRPKSRSVIRKNEATAALAFFSNPDVTVIDPVDPDNQMQAASAEVMQALLQYRLTKTIPWYLTVLGGFQDSMTVGLVCSMQVWRYKDKKEKVKRIVTGMMPDGTPISAEVEDTQIKIVQDEPCIDLIPIEYIRFDPAANWMDVVKTSPYLIVQIPMYINDILDNMEMKDQEGATWKRLDKNTLLSARIKDFDSVRMARNEGEDPEQVTSEVNEFDVVMVHMNFVKTGGDNYAYYTLEDKHLLTEPMLVSEMFKHCQDGRPPVRIGFSVIESHKVVPSSLIGLGRELQKETNEIANQRLDNVKFVLNKRSIVKRGAQVDVESLLRNVPGGVTMANDVDKDIRELNWQDVTSSSYQEQDRINVDMDELVGNFAQGSVMTNRKLNETVGGMKIMAQGANSLTEYGLITFVTTWAEPVLQDVARMEAAYETDEVILGVASSKAQVFKKYGTYGINSVTDKLLTQNLTLTVNIGMGATDPEARLQRFMRAVTMDTQMAQQGSPDLNLPEVRKEIFGLSGFKGASRFFTQVDPRLEQAKQMMATAEQKAKEILDQQKFAILERERKLDAREANFKLEALQFGMDHGASMFDSKVQAIISAQESNAKLVIKQREADVNEERKARKAEHDMLLKAQKQAFDEILKKRESDIDMMLKKREADIKQMMSAMQKPAASGATA